MILTSPSRSVTYAPAEMGAPEVTRFLTSLAVDAGVAASTQNQALSALLFLYRDRLTGQFRRHHLPESVLQRAVKDAVRRAEIAKRTTPHILGSNSNESRGIG